MTNTFDLVVAGCGAAGLSAAATAAERGLKVAVIERASQAERGGQTRYTEAYLRMKSHEEVSDDFMTHLAENAGYYSDPDLIAEMAGPRDGWSQTTRALSVTDPSLIEVLADNVPRTIAWLKTLGVRFDFLPTQFLTKSQPRLLPVGGGQALVEALAAECERRKVTFHYDTTAIDLIRGPSSAGVAGLVCKTRSGHHLRLEGPVVLACGGFEGNAEMLTRYIGPRSVYLRPVCKGGFYNKGEGIEMALRLGAAPGGDFGSYHAEPVDPRSGVSEPSVFVFPYGVLVNRRGERFTDEAPGTVDAWYERVTRRIFEQEQGIAYAVLDQRISEIPNYRLSIRTDQPAIEAKSLDDLAVALGISANGLRATIEQYNAACRPGKYDPLALDGLHTVDLAPAKSNWARPIDRPPFIAYPIISSNVFTFGGLKVDPSAQVLDHDGEPIGALYAAGETVGMYFGNYTGATSVLKALVFGRLAAEHASTARISAR